MRKRVDCSDANITISGDTVVVNDVPYRLAGITKITRRLAWSNPHSFFMRTLVPSLIAVAFFSGVALTIRVFSFGSSNNDILIFARDFSHWIAIAILIYVLIGTLTVPKNIKPMHETRVVFDSGDLIEFISADAACPREIELMLTRAKNVAESRSALP